MKNIKIIVVVMLVMVLSIGTVFAANVNLVNIFINGQRITSDVEPVIIDGRTMVPLRFIAENFGATVEWDNETRSVTITSPANEEGKGESGDPSSPILQLDEGWNGVVNGMRTDMKYDSNNQRFYGVVENVTNKKIKGILIELNLKLGAKTVVELGPEPVGDLKPGETANVELLVSEEPEAKDVKFDAWEIHPEAEGVKGEGSEGSRESGESHGSEGIEGSESSEGTESGEEGTSTGARTLLKKEKYDVTKNGARLILSYNDKTKFFEGTLKNTGNKILTRARVEIHLNNGTELGPTTPVNLKAGETINLNLEASENFDTWVTHAEFGIGEGGESSEHGTTGEGKEGTERSESGNRESNESHSEEEND